MRTHRRADGQRIGCITGIGIGHRQRACGRRRVIFGDIAGKIVASVTTVSVGALFCAGASPAALTVTVIDTSASVVHR